MNELEKAAREFQEKEFSFFSGKGMAVDLHHAFASGAEWKAKQSPWIRVEDRLPDTDNGQSLYEVLVKMNDGRCYVAANISVERLTEIGEVLTGCQYPNHRGRSYLTYGHKKRSNALLQPLLTLNLIL